MQTFSMGQNVHTDYRSVCPQVDYVLQGQQSRRSQAPNGVIKHVLHGGPQTGRNVRRRQLPVEIGRR
eukprot:8367721-Ditylum_brightwellii.AAC.1